jgi:peptidoglycan/LPS O-acetylase OafA/YrhL
VNKKQKWSLILFLTGIWAFAIVAPAFVNTYKPPPEINAAMPAIIGALLAVPPRKEGDDEE